MWQQSLLLAKMMWLSVIIMFAPWLQPLLINVGYVLLKCVYEHVNSEKAPLPTFSFT